MSLRRQRGVALITVMLVFALVAVIATEILHRSQLNLRSVSGLIETRQGYYYALAGEEFARQILASDARRSASDTLIEPWAQTKDQEPFAIDNGKLQIEIHDLQGRFNLNNIVDANGTVNTDAVGQFRKLLKTLQLDANYANEWSDWLDKDQNLAAGGGEDAEYSGYLTASADEADISALRLLRSMQPQDYAKLAPHVTVLPVVSGTAMTPININTADVEVLSSILTDSEAAKVVAQQQSGGYRTKDDFQPNTSLPIDVSSNYFEVVITVNYANRWQRVRTVLERDKTTTGPVTFKVLSRVRSPLIDDSES